MLIFPLFVFCLQVYANTSKTIFTAPKTSGLKFPNLALLSPDKPRLQEAIVPAFSTSQAPFGVERIYGLVGLAEGSKYEVRVCWAASSPTRFHLNTFYEHETLFIRLFAEAAYYSHIEELMRNVPEMEFILILDKLILGFIPESLLPVIGLVVLVGVICWTVVAPRIYIYLTRLPEPERQKAL